MGNRAIQPQNYQQQLQFYGEVEDSYFGFAQVYLSNKIPLCYIIKLTKELDKSSIYNIFQRIQDKQCPSLINLFGFQIKRKNYCHQFVSQTLTSYWSYYNFYFIDYLQRRKERSQPLGENELWHVIQACCQASIVLGQYNIFYDFLPESMVVTLDGKLKLLWSHIQSHNTHLNYFKYFEEEYIESYYSPQQLEMMIVRERSIKINFKKCNTFSLGILLIYCITLTNPLKDLYLFQSFIYRINTNKINYIKDKRLFRYSPVLQALIKKMLSWDYKYRPTISQIKLQYANYFNKNYQLQIVKPKIMNPKYKSNKHFVSSTNTDDKTPQQYSRNSPFKANL